MKAKTLIAAILLAGELGRTDLERDLDTDYAHPLDNAMFYTARLFERCVDDPDAVVRIEIGNGG